MWPWMPPAAAIGLRATTPAELGSASPIALRCRVRLQLAAPLNASDAAVNTTRLNAMLDATALGSDVEQSPPTEPTLLLVVATLLYVMCDVAAFVGRFPPSTSAASNRGKHGTATRMPASARVGTGRFPRRNARLPRGPWRRPSRIGRPTNGL